MSAAGHEAVLGEIERLIADAGEADDVLGGTVTLLHERLQRPVRIRFLEEGELVAGPAAGPAPLDVEAFPIHFQGAYVANLEVGLPLDETDHDLLRKVAELVAPHALVGWDADGEPWKA